MTLPPLPYIHAGWQRLRTATYRGALPANANRADWNQLFTADQLLAYAEQAVAAERERCAALCEGVREAADHAARDGHRKAGAMASAALCAKLIRAE